MKFIFSALNWGFGIIFLLAGITLLVTSPLGAICLIAISLLLLPPFRTFVHSKVNKKLPVKGRAATIFVLFIAFGIFSGQSEDRKQQVLVAQQAQEKAEKVAKIKHENIQKFNTNREEIISGVKAALASNNYQSVISQSARFLASNDKELLEINSKAKSELAKIRNAKKTAYLLTKLKAIPASELANQQGLYKQLSNLHPDNETYKIKLSFYAQKIKEEKQAKIAAAVRKKKIEEQFSPWDGSHRNLERVIKKAMNDPDSYEHDETTYSDRGDYLIVKTTYRGKNAFGGVVRNFVKAKVSLDGEVLQILDQT